MKPREFDELVRQKFDQNEFAYNPGNWDRLVEQMDGRAKKRSMLMWLWMPAAGMAASVALALGVTSLWKIDLPAGNGKAGYANVGKWAAPAQPAPIAMIPYYPHTTETAVPKQIRKARAVARPAAHTAVASSIGLKLNNIVPAAQSPASTTLPVVGSSVAKAVVPRKKETPDREPLRTFRHEVHTVRKPLNLSVIVMGGVCQGNRNSGYMAGATIRKMINDKVYVESDVAFATSDNTQQTMYMDYSGGSTYAGGASGATAARPGSASKTSSVTNTDKVPTTSGPVGVAKMKDVNYNLYYAQITPSIGYKIMKRMSVGVGPDFQKMLVDNRPATSEVDRGNLQVAPTFDVGFVGKTEVALTQRVRAGVSYRKGINGVINLSDEFIDRDYVQFQMRCTIFNR